MEHDKMIKLSVPNDPRLLALAGQFLLAASGQSNDIVVGTMDPTYIHTPYEDDADDSTNPAGVLQFAPQTEPADAAPTIAANTGAITPAVVGELDKDGFPWDARIHAGTKTKLSGGQWKLKPKVDQSLVEQVRAEFRANNAAAGSAVPPPPAFGQTTGAAIPPPPATTGAAIPPPPPAANTEALSQIQLFQSTMALYTRAVSAGLITAQWAGEWCIGAGLTGLPGLMANAPVCKQFADTLTAMGAV